MYPINLTKPGEQPGFAVANDEAEHASLSEHGYEPKFEGSPVEPEADPEKRKPGRPKKAE